jgi:hypothetical protein
MTVSSTFCLCRSTCRRAVASWSFCAAIEPRQHLSRLHLHPFLDVHLGHLAGDLRGDGGAAAGGDVAAGVEDRASAAAGRDRLRRRDLHLGRTIAGDPPRHQCDQDQRERKCDDERRPAPGFPLRALDAQTIQCFFVDHVGTGVIIAWRQRFVS